MPFISIMDSCASYPITQYKELIDHYKNPNIQKIKTDSSGIEVEGEGSFSYLEIKKRRK